MRVTPLYRQEQGRCVSRVPDELDQDYFSDAGCEIPVAFEPTTLASHCELLLNADQLGEGQGINTPPVWTLPPGTRLDVGARSLEGVQQPYLQRQIYRTVQTLRGECALEMRVYAPSPVSEGEQRPSLLALHGGSWSSRGFGFFGLEMTIPHYVDAGFVVYAPFYRLLGDSEGSAACNEASIEQISDDAAAALDWVQIHATDYGSSPKPVVFGQSAGAHLATSLAVNRSSEVASAVLFYTPTDFTDFALRAQQGFYTDEQGLGILERLLNVSADEADVSASPIPENSFPLRIVQEGIDIPPVFMVHGMQDGLVEARQSVRLCDALAGRQLLALDAEVEQPDTLREIVQCGAGSGASSQLQLIREGEHALDVCLAGALLPTDLCPSGSEASRQEVASAIGDAVSFANNTGRGIDGTEAGQRPAEDEVSETSGESGSGAGVVLPWLLALTLWLRRHPVVRARRSCLQDNS
ncbi:alpha/beta hydrolase [Granulosicoccus antarcticus]|nr:alpha/beta hydrolase [Granulosicoccus antarcticus]